MQRFSKGESIKFGWDVATGNLGLFVVALLIMCMISVFPVFFDSWVVGLVSGILEMVVSLGLMKMCLRFVDGDRGELVDLFATFSLLISYLIASILVGFVTTIGLILLIIPGIIWGIRFQFFGWVIVDKNVGPFEAMQESWEITRGSAWNLFLLWIMLAGINILGMMALLVGLLVTIPLTMLTIGYVYRQLGRST